MTESVIEPMITPDDIARCPFQAPWHAEVFALTLALHRAGQFSWPEWTDYLAAALKAETHLQPDSTQDEAYYQAWLAALCALVTDKNITSAADITQMKKRWADAYIHTPHGQPVHLG